MKPHHTPHRTLAPGAAVARLSLLGALTVLAPLGGCGALAPAYQRPAAPVPTAWSVAEGASLDAGAVAARLPWNDFFQEPTLKRLIATALQNNRDLRVAVLAIAQARAQWGARRADELPTVNLAATQTRAASVSGGKTVLTTIDSVGLSVSAWEIDLFHRLESLSDAAQAQYLATEAGRKAAQISLVGAVASAYYSLRSDEDGVALAQQVLASRQDSLRLTQLKFDAGAASELELQQAQSLREAARASLAQQHRQRALDENALALLLGQALPPLPMQGLLKAPALPELKAGLPSEVLTQRPDIQQAEQQLRAAQANIGAARAAFFPRISLTAAAGSVSGQLAGLFSGGTWVGTLSPLSALLPLFDAGRNEANLQTSVAARDIALAQYEKAVQTAFREVADALTNRSAWAEQVQAQRAQWQAESRRQILTRLRLSQGVASQLEVLDGERSQLAAQAALAQAHWLYTQSQVALYKALGGGWSEAKALAELRE